MNAEQIKADLLALEELHRNDRDSGDALVAAIRQYCAQLDAADRDLSRAELLRLVEQKEPTRWAVALEVLVQQWGHSISGDLAGLFTARQPDVEWEHEVLFALLRLRYHEIADPCMRHISRRLASQDADVLPLLAALSKVRPAICVQMTASFFIRQYACGGIERVRGYIPAFVHNFFDVDPNLFRELTRSIASGNRRAGQYVAEMLIDELDTPFVRNRFGGQAVQAIVASIRAALDR